MGRGEWEEGRTLGTNPVLCITIGRYRQGESGLDCLDNYSPGVLTVGVSGGRCVSRAGGGAPTPPHLVSVLCVVALPQLPPSPAPTAPRRPLPRPSSHGIPPGQSRLSLCSLPRLGGHFTPPSHSSYSSFSSDLVKRSLLTYI